MANSSLLLLLLLLLFTATAVMSASPPPPLPPPPEQEQQREQVNKIIDALVGSGDFQSWAHMLSGADPTAFPLWATFFVPSDLDYSSPLLDRMVLVMGYHIVPQRLPFSQLSLLKPLTRLPTLLPTKSILITNNSLSNFTLDDSLLSHPDLYLTPSFVVHGVQSFLDYSLYGAADNTSFPPPPSPPPPQPPQQAWPRIGSDAACLCWVWDVFLLVCGIWSITTIQDFMVPCG